MSEIEWMDIFADNLRDIILERGITQKELARELGISQSMISQYINKKKMPSAKVLNNMAYILECTTDELIFFDEMIK